MRVLGQLHRVRALVAAGNFEFLMQIELLGQRVAQGVVIIDQQDLSDIAHKWPPPLIRPYTDSLRPGRVIT